MTVISDLAVFSIVIVSIKFFFWIYNKLFACDTIYILYLLMVAFLMTSNEQCINNEYLEAVCLFTLLVDDVSGSLWHLFIFSSKTPCQHE